MEMAKREIKALVGTMAFTTEKLGSGRKPREPILIREKRRVEKKEEGKSVMREA